MRPPRRPPRLRWSARQPLASHFRRVDRAAATSSLRPRRRSRMGGGCQWPSARRRILGAPALPPLHAAPVTAGLKKVRGGTPAQAVGMGALSAATGGGRRGSSRRTAHVVPTVAAAPVVTGGGCVPCAQRAGRAPAAAKNRGGATSGYRRAAGCRPRPLLPPAADGGAVGGAVPPPPCRPAARAWRSGAARAAPLHVGHKWPAPSSTVPTRPAIT